MFLFFNFYFILVIVIRQFFLPKHGRIAGDKIKNRNKKIIFISISSWMSLFGSFASPNTVESTEIKIKNDLFYFLFPGRSPPPHPDIFG